MREANPKCRFCSGKDKCKTEEAQLVAYPFTQDRDPNLINTIHCPTPIWKLENDNMEQATLDVSINGQKYLGGIAFSFTREMRLHRDIPMSGPNFNGSAVKLVGHGHRMRSRQPSVKWGVLNTEAMNMSSLRDYKYNHDAFIQTIPGSQSLKAYEVEAARRQRVDTPLGEGQDLDLVSVDNRFIDG
jgi:hypothetical protein